MYNRKSNSEFLNSEASPSRIILINEIPEIFNVNQLINENLSVSFNKFALIFFFFFLTKLLFFF